jgi:uncharacterized protein
MPSNLSLNPSTPASSFNPLNPLNPLAFAELIAQALQVKSAQVTAAINLLNQGATVPFIARYRKEATQGLDDKQLRDLELKLAYLMTLGARKLTVLESLHAQNALTTALQTQIEACQTKTELEDLYRPFKPVRNSKASQAKAAGLEPLAQAILTNPKLNPSQLAHAYLKPALGITQVAEALDGAQAILIEQFSQSPGLVSVLRERLWREGVLSSQLVKVKSTLKVPAHAATTDDERNNEHNKFKDYFAYSETIRTIPSHRALALFRGEQTGVLKLKLTLGDVRDSTQALTHPFIERMLRFYNLNLKGVAAESFLTHAIDQAWRTKLSKMLQTELLTRLRHNAETVAIEVFAQNLKALLLAAPAGAKITLALDPGFRSGVKLAIVDATGKFLQQDVIYPHAPQNQWTQALASLKNWVTKYKVQLISIGNGTASRETEQLVEALLTELKESNTLTTHPLESHKMLEIPQKVVVSEAGASVYSASEIAQKEFPQLDVTIRGAVSIARRLQDPLAELVKIDPKAIGVGQYQHDVDQSALAQSLYKTVEDCVNLVGVDLNIASSALLAYVSGLSPRLADEIVQYRDQNGAFANRQQLKKVPRLGPTAFEQCAGFLRIRGGNNPLDASAVHPESYAVVEAIAKKTNLPLNGLIGQKSVIEGLNAAGLSADFDHVTMGLMSVKDLLVELEKPGRDPRPDFKVVSFAQNITKIGDLSLGLELEGVITNVTHFGAFVDVGVHQDGLVHISQLANQYVSDPHTIVKVGQIVTVRVVEVDVARKRIALTMRDG